MAETPEALRDAAVELAREAGAILLEGYGRPHAPERKGRIDLVTEFDRRSEAFLLERLHQRFPGHRVLAEESGAHDAAPEPPSTPATPDSPRRPAPAHTAMPSTAAARATRWIIDPLDGTTNFAHNYPFFAVSIAAEVQGEVVAAAVYDPVRDEMFSAARGSGATRNREAIRVSGIERLEDALLVTGFPYTVREQPEPILSLFRAFLVRAQGIRRDGSAALNLCYLACGRFDGFWESHLSPWDMAAGVLIVREAGGTVTSLTHGPFRLDGRQILASNGRLHEEMAAVIRGVTVP